MKYFLPFLLSSALLVSTAYASDLQKEEKQSIKHKKAFDGYDHNKDGLVADFELSKDMIERFKIRDMDKDGKVTRVENLRTSYDEYSKTVYGPVDKRIPLNLVAEYQFFFNLEDLNKDGLVTAYENMRSYRMIFEKADTDKSGFMTWGEYIIFVKSL